MNFSYGLLPPLAYWGALLAFSALLVFAAWQTKWKRLLEDTQKLNVFLGSCVALLVLWQLEAGLKPGLSYHLLGGTLFVLMFDWPLAIIGIALVLLGTTLNGMGDFASLGLNGLVMGGIPVFLSYGIYRFAVRYLPHHFFVYVMANAFLCGALSMFATVGSSTLLLACCSPYTFDKVITEYLPFAPLMMFGEAFFTGMLAASLVLFRPEWVSTFDDRRYLSGK